MEVNQLSEKVGEVFYTANRNFCLPGVPWDMVRAACNVIAVVKEESHGWGKGTMVVVLWGLPPSSCSVSTCPPRLPASDPESAAGALPRFPPPFHSR